MTTTTSVLVPTSTSITTSFCAWMSIASRSTTVSARVARDQQRPENAGLGVRQNPQPVYLFRE
jgi:hypothetical protein